MGSYFFIDIFASHTKKRAMAGLKKSFENGTVLTEYAGNEQSKRCLTAGLFLATGPKEARLMFRARGNKPPAALLQWLKEGGFDCLATAYDENDQCCSTQEPPDLSDLPFDDVFSRALRGTSWEGAVVSGSLAT